LTLPLPASSGELGLHLMVDGLLHDRLPDGNAYGLLKLGAQVIDAGLRSSGFKLSQEPDRSIDVSAFQVD